ncbi:hypothetical protein COU17_02240 [Candidatus Kaiserbacteria bacterium CG10_big_fil_rev_8_21_14_0_10_49_17]|uniref:Rod shape-determining protein MreD n=1 Tax=Candidatus Kaiserbacteria bacterium CG10_big_fil_rev_8_21_14_0_10_49_17 TaxID=1974609 RepID=A0A2M6WE80_9BACT|nr:MAG: hypothetical protein COU17_02240 [Candidatus Kaiserbacteria bacterium CG10_big_fil_rev_8_21_14_0_10_49_17]
MIRALLNVGLFASVLFFPWWVSLGFLGALLVRAPSFEVIIAGILLDALYAPSGSVPIYTVSFTALYILSALLERRLLKR